MATKIETLKKPNGDQVLPRTRAKAVFMENGITVEAAIADKSNNGHAHTVKAISDLSASATELNYMKGVTSNVQTQLDGKAPASHNHNDNYYTKVQIDNFEFITVADIDEICGATISYTNSEVTF